MRSEPRGLQSAMPAGEAIRPSLLWKTAFLFQLLLGTAMSALLIMTLYQLRIQQREIEYGTRAEVGLWLKEHQQPGETVFLEPLGYIGYYSDAVMRDFPGLVAPDVVRLRKKGVPYSTALIQLLKPDWLVFRPSDVNALYRGVITEWYEPVEQFDARDRLKTYHYIPGRGYLEIDARFFVFRKRPESSP